MKTAKVRKFNQFSAKIDLEVDCNELKYHRPSMYQCQNLYKILYFLSMSYHDASRLVRGILVLMVNSTILDLESELLFLLRQLGLQLLVRVPDRLDLEQALDFLQRNTTGLGDEEEGEEEGEEGQGGEEEVDTVSHGREHLFGESRDKEVEQPVAGSGAGLSQRTEVGVEEFLFVIVSTGSNVGGSMGTYRVDDPGGTVPGRSVDRSPQIEEENSGDTTTVKGVGGMIGWVHDVDVGTNNPHADRAGDSTNEEKLTSAQLINQEEQPDEGHDGLDDSEDTSHNANSVAGNPNAL
jgi:hypothetical protein